MDPAESFKSAARAKRRQQRLSLVQNPLVESGQALPPLNESLHMTSLPRVLPSLDLMEPPNEDAFAATQQSLPSAVEDTAQAARRRRREQNAQATLNQQSSQLQLTQQPPETIMPPADPPPRHATQPQEMSQSAIVHFPVAEEDVIEGPPPSELLFTRTLRLRDDIAPPSRSLVPPSFEAGPKARQVVSVSPEPLPIKMLATIAQPPSTFQEHIDHWSKFIFNVSHGLLAGTAVCQLLVSRELDANDDALVARYARVALSLAALFLPLLTVCVASVWTRLGRGWADPARRLAWLVAAGIAYGAALVFTLIMADVDVQLEFAASIASSKDVTGLASWRALNVLRFVGCLLGWLLLVVDENLTAR